MSKRPSFETFKKIAMRDKEFKTAYELLAQNLTHRDFFEKEKSSPSNFAKNSKIKEN